MSLPIPRGPLSLFLLPALLLCCLSCFCYRYSGGEPGLLCRIVCSHGNKENGCCYLPAEERTKLVDTLEEYRSAMAADIAAKGSCVAGYWYMRHDHREFCKRGKSFQGLEDEDDAAAAREVPGVAAVLFACDLPAGGHNSIGPISHDEEIFADPKVRTSRDLP